MLPYAVLATALGLGLFVVVGQISDSLLNARDEAGQNAYWAVNGAPCPQATAADFAVGPLKITHEFAFEGVRFADAFGEADCRAYGNLVSSYRRCMFTSPGVVRVRADGIQAFYTPGIGRPVTVSVEDGKVSCVMAGRVSGPAGKGDDIRDPTAKGWLPQ